MTQVDTTTHVCPICGRELSDERGALHCEEHGDFFSYGPQLLVRCVSEEYTSPIPRLMPWERLDEQAA
jgi:hypothetical protein